MRAEELPVDSMIPLNTSADIFEQIDCIRYLHRRAVVMDEDGRLWVRRDAKTKLYISNRHSVVCWMGLDGKLHVLISSLTAIYIRQIAVDDLPEYMPVVLSRGVVFDKTGQVRRRQIVLRPGSLLHQTKETIKTAFAAIVQRRTQK